MAIETALAEAAARRRTEVDINALEAILTSAETITDLSQLAELDVRFHERLAKAAGNPLFDVVLNPLAELLCQERPFGLALMGATIAHEDHRAILRAVRQGNAAAAARAMRRHLSRLTKGE